MFSTFSTLICVVLSLIAFLYQDHVIKIYNKFASVNKTILAISILSSRDNFKQRAAARSTWLKELSSGDAKAWFIVGGNSCEVPPEYRLSVYGCEKWDINLSGLAENFYTSEDKTSTLSCSPEKKQKSNQGFSFKVNYPAVVTMLGVHSEIVEINSSPKVALMDVQNKENILEAVISSNTSNFDGYIYKQVDPVLLPKGFEGLLLVEGYLKDEICSNAIWNNGSGVLAFKRIYSTHFHLESQAFSPGSFATASLKFYVPEIEKLKETARQETEVREKWLFYLEELNKRLRNEMEENQDILIVDVVDTYRSLPAKLLKFYQWLESSYMYSCILKTDDDSVINVPRLLQTLQAESHFHPERFWIWSRFRKDWPVNYIGKWADYDYQSSSYPAFPCGAAYVMSHKLAWWLAENAEYLHPYQGEDVSMGIWLSAIHPELIEDANFACDTSCNSKNYNQAQVNESQVYQVWSNFKHCQNFCNCTK